MNLLERIKLHRQKEDKVRQIEVPEWGDEKGPLIIVAQAESLEDFNAISTAAEKGAGYAVVETLKRLALDTEGTKIFKGASTTDLIKWASGPVALRVAAFLRAPSIPQDELVKNSEASQTSD